MKSNLNSLLIVEDNSFVSNNIYNAVKDINGIENIKSAALIKDAISFFEESFFNLVILDLRLPDGSGLDFLKMLNKKQIKTKVFVFSISTELKKTCLRYGAHAFFDKADDFDKLIESIREEFSITV